jgi:hypothetical protein
LDSALNRVSGVRIAVGERYSPHESFSGGNACEINESSRVALRNTFSEMKLSSFQRFSGSNELFAQTQIWPSVEL